RGAREPKLLASTSVVNEVPVQSSLENLQIRSRALAGLTIGDEIVRDFLSLIKSIHSSAFDGADMDENILAAVTRLNEAKSLFAIEPLHGSLCHKIFLSDCARICPRARPHCRAACSNRVLGKSSVRRKARGEAKSFRPKLDVRNIRVYLPDDKEFHAVSACSAMEDEKAIEAC